MHVDFAERHFVGNVETEHDHASNPLEEKIGTSFHDRGWIIAFLLVSDDEWPLAGAEPCIEGVVVANISFAVFGNFNLVYSSVKNPIARIVLVLESGDRNAPRNLTANIPIVKLFEVVDKGAFFAGGIEFYLVVFKSSDSAVGEWLDVDEPLFFEERFNDSVAFVAVTDRMGDFFLAAEESGVL